MHSEIMSLNLTIWEIFIWQQSPLPHRQMANFLHVPSTKEALLGCVCISVAMPEVCTVPASFVGDDTLGLIPGACYMSETRKGWSWKAGAHYQRFLNKRTKLISSHTHSRASIIRRNKMRARWSHPATRCGRHLIILKSAKQDSSEWWGELNQELPFSLQLSWKMLTPLVQKPTKDIILTTNLKAGLTASELNIPKFKKVTWCSLPVL